MGEAVGPGDWVRFYLGGRLVIGVVQYVRVDEMNSNRIHVHTDAGTTWASGVLEARREVLK